MNKLLGNSLAAHESLLARQDAQHPRAAESGPGGRLARSHVLLIAGGDLGRRAAASLRRLPFAMLTLVPLAGRDAPALREVVSRPGPGGPAHALPSIFNAANFGGVADAYHLVAFAADRPHPQTCEDLNEVCLRVGVPWTQVSTWGAEVILGPTIIPGLTACHHCYVTRRRTNEPNADLFAAREQFLRNDPEFAYAGRLEPLSNTAVAYFTSEVIRFLSGERPPVALGSEFAFDALSQKQLVSQVVPLEGCPHCRLAPRRGAPDDGDALGAVVRKLQTMRGGEAGD